MYSFLTTALDWGGGGEGSASRPGLSLCPGIGTPVPIVQEAGWAPELVWTQRPEEKSFCLCRGSKPDLPVVHFVGKHYIEGCTPVTLSSIITEKAL
jgi:hypothetical protein